MLEREEDDDFEARLTEHHDEIETLNSEAHELEKSISEKFIQILEQTV